MPAGRYSSHSRSSGAWMLPSGRSRPVMTVGMPSSPSTPSSGRVPPASDGDRLQAELGGERLARHVQHRARLGRATRQGCCRAARPSRVAPCGVAAARSARERAVDRLRPAGRARACMETDACASAGITMCTSRVSPALTPLTSRLGWAQSRLVEVRGDVLVRGARALLAQQLGRGRKDAELRGVSLGQWHRPDPERLVERVRPARVRSRRAAASAHGWRSSPRRRTGRSADPVAPVRTVSR